MKFYNFMLIFAIALFCLFSLQTFWLNYTYQLHLRNIEESVNSLYNQTIEKELNQRFLEMEKNLIKTSFDSSVRIDSFRFDLSGPENKSIVSQQVDIFQKLMANYNINFNMVAVDSIFHSMLQSNQYPFKYRINYVDSTNRIINTAGYAINKGFKTSVVSIINGEKTYAIVKITAPVVFRNMLLILIVSILIFFFIIACIIYEMRVFINQHHLNQLRENFTHALTHDMKTPLSTIHSVLVQFENGVIDKDPEMRRKFCSVAIEQAINLQNTVDQILTLACFEKKQLSLDKQAVNLPSMIQSLVDEFTIKTNKVVKFKTFCDLKDFTLYADSFYLNNVISNLIDNAIKYSNESVEIFIECIAGEEQIYIRVKDNGLGISKDDQLKIFNRFERGAEIKRNRISGFGIGLNYVHQIVAAHGGTVTLLSQVGTGSEFIITFPTQIGVKEEIITK